MDEKRFFKILVSVVIICSLLTLLHMIYGIFAYKQSSIIQFIAKELW